MRYVAAYLLACLGNNANPSAKDIKNILDSVGIEADSERLDKVISELSGKSINEIVEAGKSKLASVPTGGVAAAAGGGAAAAGGEAKEEKKEEEKKKEESEEESDDDMGFGLFD